MNLFFTQLQEFDSEWACTETARSQLDSEDICQDEGSETLLNIGGIILKVECNHISTFAELFWTVYGYFGVTTLFSENLIPLLNSFNKEFCVERLSLVDVAVFYHISEKLKR